MSLLARHRYMVQRVADAFGYADEDQVEQMMLVADVLQAIDFFFTAAGPRKIIVTIVDEEEKEKAKAVHHKKRAHAAAAQQKEAKKVMKIFFSDVEVLPRIAVYFMKARRHAEDNAPREIDPTKVDSTLAFGIIRAPLKSLEMMMRCVYRPMMQAMETDAWGDANHEQQNEFVQSIDLFSKGLEDSIRNLTGGIELKKPDERVEALGHAAANDPDLVIKSLNLLDDWCRAIEAYLDDSGRAESMESGPDTELTFWRSRMQRLASITEQLKNKSVSAVISLLSYVARPVAMVDPSIDSQRVASLLAQWREIDVQITEAANEAKDNVKYLSTLERFFDPLYGNDPGAITDTLPALVNAVRMIHTIAMYYGTTERVTKLLMKISNQMIACCKLALNGRDTPDRLWEKDMPSVLETIEKCLQLNESYQENYRATKEKMMAAPKGKQFDFSEMQIFGKFDLFCRRLIKLMDMFSTVQQFKSLAEQVRALARLEELSLLP